MAKKKSSKSTSMPMKGMPKSMPKGMPPKGMPKRKGCK